MKLFETGFTHFVLKEKLREKRQKDPKDVNLVDKKSQKNDTL